MSRPNDYRLGASWVASMQNGLGVAPVVQKVVATANTLAVFTGDMVDETTDGVVYPCTVGGGAFPALAYVVVGVERYRDAEGMMRQGSFVPAATAYTGGSSLLNPLATVVKCIPVANQVFAITIPTAAASLAAAQGYIGKCTDIDPGAGSIVTGQSGHQAAAGGWQATTVSAQLRLWRIPEYGIAGLNNPLLANWTGHFIAHEIRGAI